MQKALYSLTAHVVEVVRRHSDAYLPWSPLSGIGQAGDLAAQHPAFADTPGQGTSGNA